MTAIFTSKLDRLVETIALAADFDHRGLAAAMQACSAVPAIAVGSGGSAIVTEFFAACRFGLGHPPTAVVTPMAFVLDAAAAPGTHAWLFSASGGNPDILAAFDAAAAEHGGEMEVVTSGPDGALARRAIEMASRGAGPRLHLAPVADPKDGFLATHSAIAAAAAMTLASDELAGAPERSDRNRGLLEDGARCLSRTFRDDLRKTRIAAMADRETVFVLHDPHLTAAAVLLETSFWEAGICAVQRADFRNFAHGRHVWMARHPGRTFVIALTCERSRNAWEGIRAELPDAVPSAHFDFGRPGRGSLFEALLTSLGLVEAAGALKNVDPGKPGVADFGKRIFEREDLRNAMSGDDASTRRKRRARGRVDPPSRETIDWKSCRDIFAARLSEAEIRAIILDYDGTVVSTLQRLDPPRADVIAALTALAGQGAVIAFATGRGGSIGTMLRAQMPPHLHHAILVGYYNGAHIVPLDVDIEKHPPAADPSIADIHAALCAEDELFAAGWLPKAGPLQITVPFERLVSRNKGIERISEIVENSPPTTSQPAPAARVFRSGHSIDVFPGWAGKAMVVDEVRRVLRAPGAQVLSVGDSGDCQGNDYELLGGLGLSVDKVCDREDAGWNLLPAGIAGPDGLSRILAALKPSGTGALRLDVSVLFAK